MRAVVRLRKEPHYRRESFDLGLKRVGFKLCDIQAPKGPSDWLILWNKKAGADEAFADTWERLGGTVIVSENAYLSKVDKTYYALSVHGHNGSGWFPVGNEDRFANLGIKMRPWRNGLGEMLVRAQRGVGSKLMASPPQWAEKLVAKFKANKVTARLVPHPGDKLKFERDLKAMEKAGILHIWSSAMGVRALVEGVTVIHHAPHWICAGANESNRLEKLQHAAHGQWHHEEIATGEPFARILATLKDKQ